MNSFAVAITKQELSTQVSTDGHMGLVDEPIEIGGQNKGPTPYDLLCGALASCTSITLRLYANRKKWDVSRIRVEVKYNQVYKEDCTDCEDKLQKIDQFDRFISIEGAIEDDQKKRLIEIANKCPIHKILDSENRINTYLK